MKRWNKVLYKKNNTTFYIEMNKKSYNNFFLIGVGFIWNKFCDSNATSNYFKTGICLIFGDYEFHLSLVKTEKKTS